VSKNTRAKQRPRLNDADIIDLNGIDSDWREAQDDQQPRQSPHPLFSRENVNDDEDAVTSTHAPLQDKQQQSM